MSAPYVEAQLYFEIFFFFLERGESWSREDG